MAAYTTGRRRKGMAPGPPSHSRSFPLPPRHSDSAKAERTGQKRNRRADYVGFERTFETETSLSVAEGISIGRRGECGAMASSLSTRFREPSFGWVPHLSALPPWPTRPRRNGETKLNRLGVQSRRIPQRKLLTPNKFAALEAVRVRLRLYEELSNHTPRPFAWKFTWQDMSDCPKVRRRTYYTSRGQE